jgi:hypothetical protein
MEALKAVEGNIEDTEKFLSAIPEITFDGMRGRFYFEKEAHRGISGFYISKIEKRGGKVQPIIIKRYEVTPIKDLLEAGL